LPVISKSRHDTRTERCFRFVTPHSPKTGRSMAGLFPEMERATRATLEPPTLISCRRFPLSPTALVVDKPAYRHFSVSRLGELLTEENVARWLSPAQRDSFNRTHPVEPRFASFVEDALAVRRTPVTTLS